MLFCHHWCNHHPSFYHPCYFVIIGVIITLLCVGWSNCSLALQGMGLLKSRWARWDHFTFLPKRLIFLQTTKQFASRYTPVARQQLTKDKSWSHILHRIVVPFITIISLQGVPDFEWHPVVASNMSHLNLGNQMDMDQVGNQRQHRHCQQHQHHQHHQHNPHHAKQ